MVLVITLLLPIYLRTSSLSDDPSACTSNQSGKHSSLLLFGEGDKLLPDTHGSTYGTRMRHVKIQNDRSLLSLTCGIVRLLQYTLHYHCLWELSNGHITFTWVGGHQFFFQGPSTVIDSALTIFLTVKKDPHSSLQCRRYNAN